MVLKMHNFKGTSWVQASDSLFQLKSLGKKLGGTRMADDLSNTIVLLLAIIVGILIFAISLMLQ